MQLKYHILTWVIFALLIEGVVSASKDRKKNKNRNRQDEQDEDDEGRKGGTGLGLSEDKRKETKDRVKDLVEREEERKERHEKKEEESSEEKDKEKEKNSTEIIIPATRFRRHHRKEGENSVHLVRHRRHEHTLKKTSEINDGQQTALHAKPQQDHQCGPDCKHSRSRRVPIYDYEGFNDYKRKQEKHKKRHEEEMEKVEQAAEAEDDLIFKVRERRSKAGKKDIGHRAATHPHTNKRTGIKAGRRRGQNNAALADGKKAFKSRTARQLAVRYSEVGTLNKDVLRLMRQDPPPHNIIFGENHRSDVYSRPRRGGVFPEDPKDRESTGRNWPANDEGVSVAADAASITDY